MKGPREEPEMSQNFSSGVNRMWRLLTSYSFHQVLPLNPSNVLSVKQNISLWPDKVLKIYTFDLSLNLLYLHNYPVSLIVSV